MNEMTDAYVKLDKVSKIYGTKEVKIVAVDEISFEIANGRVCSDRWSQRCGQDNSAEHSWGYGSGYQRRSSGGWKEYCQI